MATDDDGRTTEDTAIIVADGATGTTGTATDGADLLNNDRDPDTGSTLSITHVGADAANQKALTAAGIGGSNGGLFRIRADGSWNFVPNNQFDDLADGKTRTTSVVYTVSDGGLSDTATLTVTVTGVNDAPTAMADSGATAANTRLTVADGDSGTEVTSSEIVTDPVTNDTSTVITTMTINADLLLNDEDADDDDTLTITAVKGYTDVDPNDKTRQRQDVATGAETFGKNGGVFTLNANGAWSFDPNGDFNDLTADETRTTSVEYTVADVSGATSTATLTVTVSPNSAPVAFVDPGTTDEDTVLTVADGATGTARAGGVGRDNADLLLNDRGP